MTALINRQGTGGVRVLEDLDSATARELLTPECTTPRLRPPGEVGLTDERVNSVERPTVATNCQLDADFLDSVGAYAGRNDDFDAQAFARRYNDLEGENAEQFRELAKNDEYGQSWIRVVDNGEISTADIRIAIDRTENLQSNNHQLRQYDSADELNEGFDGLPPHKEGTIVIEADAQGQDTLYRVYDEDNMPAGEWLTDRQVLESAETQSEIYDELALLPNQWDSNYNYVGELDTSERAESRDD